MKIQIVDANTKKPLMNTKIQLQVKGKDSGFLTLTTDATGHLQLDEKYQGQQIMSPTAGSQGPWVAAAEGVILAVINKNKTTESTHSAK
jgi:hypothetical protein